jgi:hypothetical protein
LGIFHGPAIRGRGPGAINVLQRSAKKMRKIIMILVVVNFFSVTAFSQERIQDVLENYDPELQLMVYIRGNFINSDMVEVIAFYERKPIENTSIRFIDESYCFVLENDFTIHNAFAIPFFTSAFSIAFNLGSMPMKTLGKSIDWMGYSIGRVGDFNNNGRDELYLYTSAPGFYPSCFEFDPDKKEFKTILDYGNEGAFVKLLEIDAKQKKFTFTEGISKPTGKIITFQWDESQQIYIKHVQR